MSMNTVRLVRLFVCLCLKSNYPLADCIHLGNECFRNARQYIYYYSRLDSLFCSMHVETMSSVTVKSLVVIIKPLSSCIFAFAVWFILKKRTNWLLCSFLMFTWCLNFISCPLFNETSYSNSNWVVETISTKNVGQPETANFTTLYTYRQLKLTNVLHCVYACICARSLSARTRPKELRRTSIFRMR